MTTEKKIEYLLRLSEFLDERVEELRETMENAYQRNKWFTPENILLSVKNIREQFLDRKKIEQWLLQYSVLSTQKPFTVGIVMAGNIPLVGFHDFLCVFLAGHKALIKLSSKDDQLFPFLLKKLFEMDNELTQWITISDVIKGMGAAIATGSNNSSRYFEYYFGKYPHIIRRNRNGAAVLTGNETKDDLENLGSDVFTYFGLGCRNVSKIFVPAGYSFDQLFESLEKYKPVAFHNKYGNNFDYYSAIFTMNRVPHLQNGFLILKEDMQVASPVSVVHYEFYKDKNELSEKLKRDEENIQCIAGNEFLPFGTTQSPGLGDYADGVDTMKFLLSLR